MPKKKEDELTIDVTILEDNRIVLQMQNETTSSIDHAFVLPPNSARSLGQKLINAADTVSPEEIVPRKRTRPFLRKK